MEEIPLLEENFTFHGKIGEGTFSSVFLASLNDRQDKKKLFAIKSLIPTCHPSRIERELRCLKDIGGKNNVIGIDGCLRSNNSVMFIMPYISHERFNDYYLKMGVEETVLYIKNLLIALKHVHSYGIIHRDVKPSNFLYNRKNKICMLVDFGLAQDVNDKTNSGFTDVSNEKINFKRKLSLTKEDYPSSKRVALYENVYASSEKATADSKIYDINKENNPSCSKKNINTIINRSVKESNLMANRSNNVLKENSLNNKIIPAKIKTFQKATRKLNFDKKEKSSIGQIFSLCKKNVSLSTTLNISENKNTKHSKIKNGLKGNKYYSKVCSCYKKPSVCNICMSKKKQNAQRAGTPGFRPPEVLLKYSQQSTGVDIWAVGVILISILSGCYPFFKASDDMMALAQIITLFGNKRIESVADILGLSLICNEKKEPIDLKKLCITLKTRSRRKTSLTKCNECEINKIEHCFCFSNFQDDQFPNSAYDLLYKLLDVNPRTRITAEEALKHPFFQQTE